MSPSLIINGIIIPVRSRLDMQQTLEPVGGASRRRLANGGLFLMQRWRKWRTTIKCAGWIPAPLLTMDFSLPYEIHCVKPVTLLPGETLPNGWRERTDFVPADALDEQAGTLRMVYPIITVLSDPPTFGLGTDPSWDLNAEEV